MGLIISASIKKEDIEKLTEDQMIKGKTATFIPLSIFVDDKNDNYGNNVSVQLSQSQEDREAKKTKTYLGNGKVVFSKGDIKTAKEIAANSGNSDEPF
jgi:hypothetical protein